MTELRAYKSETLRRTTDGLSGASVVGVPPITGLSAQADNVEIALKELADRIAPNASETQAGIAEIATQAETDTGTDNSRIVTPLKLANRTATETRAGMIEHATEAEVQAGTEGNLVATVARLKAELDRRAPAPDAYAELTRAAVQSIPNATFTAVSWNTETRDPSGWHGTTNPERVSPGVAGMYEATVFTAWAQNTTGVRRVRLVRGTGARVAEVGMLVNSGMPDCPQTLSALIYLDAADYLTVEVFQSSGAALDLSAVSTLTVSRVV